MECSVFAQASDQVVFSLHLLGYVRIRDAQVQRYGYLESLNALHRHVKALIEEDLLENQKYELHKDEEPFLQLE